MRNYVVNVLSHILQNVDDDEVNVFDTYREREEVVVSVNNGGRESEKACGGSGEQEFVKDTAGAKQEKTSGTGTNVEESETTTEVTSTVEKKNKIRILTAEGGSFVNAILDTTAQERAIQFLMNEQYKAGEYQHPDINMFRVLNQSKLSYYNADGERFSKNEDDMLLEYPNLTDDAIDWVLDEDGNPYMPMDPDRYKMMWERIIAASRKLDASKINVNKTVTKPVLYWNDVKLAYDSEGNLRRVRDKQITTDDLMLATIVKPVFKISPINVFTRKEHDRGFSDLDIAIWSIRKQGENDAEAKTITPNSNAVDNPNSRFNQIAAKGKGQNK